MSTHTDDDPNLWKIFFWLLFACLIGVYLLYNHQTGVQQAELERAKTALADAKARLTSFDSELAEHEAATRSAEQKLSRLREAHTAETAAVKAAHAEAVAAIKSEHARALDDLKTAHTDAIDAMRTEHATQVEQLKIALAEAEQAATDMERELATIRQRSADMERELAQNIQSVTALNEQLVEVTEENHELNAKLAADNETIAGLNYELNAATQLEAALRDKLKRGADRQERLQTLVDKEEAAILDLQDKLVALTREREALAARADDAAKAAAGEPTQWQEELVASQAVIADLRAELEAAVREREQAEAAVTAAPEDSEEAEQATAELTAARARIQALEAQTAELEGQLAKQETALNQARAAAEEAQNADVTAALKTEIESLQKERAALRSELEVAKAAAAQDNSDDEARVTQLQAQVEALETKLAEAEAAGAGLEEQLAAAETAHQEALAGAAVAGKTSAERLQTLYAEAAELGARLTEDGILLSLAGDELRFASGTATLPDEELPSLDRMAEFLKSHPGLTIRIEGHTDSSGSAEVNQQLSQQRAEAVMQALVERGVPAARIAAQGLGAERPIADNATERGRRENRRVEVYAIGADGES